MNTRVDQLKEFLKEDPSDTFLIYALALEYSKAETPDLAIQTFLQLIEKNPEYVATYYQLGKIYESIGETIKASAVYSKGMDLSKNDSNKKTYLELKEAYNLLMDIDEDEW
jgi:tetratricopeptide (TPR) repeat protein